MDYAAIATIVGWAFIATLALRIITKHWDHISRFFTGLWRWALRKDVIDNVVDEFNYPAFVAFCIDLLDKNDYTNIKTINNLDHRKKDILAEKAGVKFIVRCNSAAAKTVNEMYKEMLELKEAQDVNVRVILSYQLYLPEVMQLARDEGVTLWDSDFIDILSHTAETKTNFTNKWNAMYQED